MERGEKGDKQEEWPTTTLTVFRFDGYSKIAEIQHYCHQQLYSKAQSACITRTVEHLVGWFLENQHSPVQASIQHYELHQQNPAQLSPTNGSAKSQCFRSSPT